MYENQSISRFWNRITTGLTLQELWTSFQKETRSSLAVYEAEGGLGPQIAKGKPLERAWALAKAMFLKLSPARRLLLLVALLFVVTGLMPQAGEGVAIQVPPPGVYVGTAGLLFLLAMELADRVALKRDLEIAKDIQSLLLPSAMRDSHGNATARDWSISRQ